MIDTIFPVDKKITTDSVVRMLASIFVIIAIATLLVSLSFLPTDIEQFHNQQELFFIRRFFEISTISSVILFLFTKYRDNAYLLHFSASLLYLVALLYYSKDQMVIYWVFTYPLYITLYLSRIRAIVLNLLMLFSLIFIANIKSIEQVNIHYIAVYLFISLATNMLVGLFNRILKYYKDAENKIGILNKEFSNLSDDKSDYLYDLSQINQKYAIYLQSISDVFVEIKPDGTVLYTNHSAFAKIGDNVFDHIVKSERAAFIYNIANAARENKTILFTQYDSMNEYKTIKITPLRRLSSTADMGNTLLLVFYRHNSFENKTLLAQKDVQQISKMASWIYNGSTKLLTSTEHFFEMLNLDYTLSFTYSDLISFVIEEDKHIIINFIKSIENNGLNDLKTIEIRLLSTNSKSHRWVKIICKPIQEPYEKIQDHIGVIIDIHELKLSKIDLENEKKHLNTVFEKQKYLNNQLRLRESELLENERLLRISNKRLEENIQLLERSQYRSKLLSEASFEAIIIVDGQKIIDSNFNAVTLFGYKKEDFFSLDITSLFDPDIMDFYFSNYSLLFEKPIEISCVDKQKNKFEAEIQAKVLVENDDKSMIIYSIRDIRERKEAEKKENELQHKIIENEANLKALIENTDMYLISLDNEGRVIMCNEAFKRKVRYEFSEELSPGDLFLKKISQQFAHILTPLVHKAYRNEAVKSVIKLNSDKSTDYLRISINPILIQNRVVGVTIFGEGITDMILTEQKLVKALEKEQVLNKTLVSREQELLESKIELERSQRIARMGRWYYDLIENKITWSKEVFEAFGMKNQTIEPSYDQYLLLLHRADRILLEQKVRNAIDFKTSFEVEIRHRQPDYSYQWYNSIGEPVLNEEGDVIALNGVIMYIHERKIAQERLQTFYKINVDLFSLIDLEGNFKDTNHAWVNLGYSDSDLKNLKIEDIIHPDDWSEFDTHIQMLLLGEKDNTPFICRIADKNGAYRWYSWLMNLLMEEKIFYCSGHDITDMKQAEDRIVKSVVKGGDIERERIAKELHDSLGQTLIAASLNLSSLQKKLNDVNGERSSLDNVLQLINDAIHETREISHNLMPKALDDFGLVSTLESLIYKLTRATEYNIILDHNFEYERLEKEIEINLFRITQEALNNIIKHANAKNINLQLIKHPHQLIYIIEDDGVGFDLNQNKELKDTGLGLSNIRNRVKSISGDCYIDSHPGKGTTITIELSLN